MLCLISRCLQHVSLVLFPIEEFPCRHPQEVDSSGARLQGQTVAVSARSCHLSDVYADRARLEVRSGNLRMGTLHADAAVTAAGEGRIVIG